MMRTSHRRDLVKQLVSSGVILSSGSWLSSLGYAQTGPRTAASAGRAIINQNNVRSNLDRRLLGLL